MISQTAEYALRAVVHLADHGDSRPAQQIAAATQVPAPFLSKVLQALARAGLVRSQRGLHGGFVLAKPAAEMTVLDVINAVDPIQRIQGCPLKLAEHSLHLCPLHHRLDQALALVEQTFRQSTIAEMVPKRSGRTPTCPFPNLPLTTDSGARNPC